MNLEKYISKELIMPLAIIILTILIFSFALFGFAGIRFVLGFIIIWIPFYLILNNFDLELGEKFIFSVLMGITLFPSIVYLIGLVISFRISIVITFILFTGLSFIIKKFKKH